MTFPNIVEKTRSQCGIGISAVGIFCLALASSALAMQTSGPVSVDSHVPVATTSTHPARERPTVVSKQRTNTRETKPEKQPNPSDVSAEPATVRLENGELTVTANNSDLAQILRNISKISGMTIDGLHATDRIFGVYGPGNPSDVLTALLSGSRYNFVIIGDKSDGAPRKLLLTAKTGKPPTPAEAPTNAPPAAEAPANAPPAATEEPSNAPPAAVEEPSDEPSTAAEEPDSSPSTVEPPPPGGPETGDPEEDRAERVQRMMQRLQAQHDQQQQNAAPQ